MNKLIKLKRNYKFIIINYKKNKKRNMNSNYEINKNKQMNQIKLFKI